MDYKTEYVAPIDYVHCGMLWSVLLKCTLAILKPDSEKSMYDREITRWLCHRFVRLYKPRSSLFKFGAQIPCYSGIINLNDSAYLYTNKVRLRNFLWLFQLCVHISSYCYNIYITIIITVHEKQNRTAWKTKQHNYYSTARKTKQQWKITKAYIYVYIQL